MGKIILKGEIHNSKQDLEEEKELLSQDNIDALVYEGKENSCEITPLNFWYAFLINFPLYLLSSIFGYKSSEKEVIESANSNDVRVERTRDNNLEIYEDTPNSIKVAFWLIVLSLFWNRQPFLMLTLSVSLLLVFMSIFRCVNMKVRNHKIANKISRTWNNSQGDVLAIFGESHRKGIVQSLSARGINREEIEIKESKETSLREKIMTFLCS